MGWFGPSKRELMERLEETRAEVGVMRARLQAAQGRGGGQTSSGVEMMAGQFRYDPNSEMRGKKLQENLDLMEADSHIKGALRTNQLPMISAEWTVKPASQKPRDVEMAELVSANILCQSEKFGRQYCMGTPWLSQRLPEILRCLRDGFAAFSYTTKVVKGKRVFDRMQWIEPDTIDGIRPWVLGPGDELLGLNRTYRDGLDRQHFEEFIPAGRLKLFVWEMLGARYAGRSLLRSAYGAWYRKDHYQRWGAIWAQKVGAPVPMGLYPDEWEPDVRLRFEEFLMSLRGTSPEHAYLMAPLLASGKEPVVKYIGQDTGEVDRMGSLISGENAEIAHAAGTKSQQLGETASGTRALGRDQRQGEMILVSAVAKIICDQINHGIGGFPGLVHHLIDMNFQNVKKYPQIICSRIDPDEGIRAMEGLPSSVEKGIVPNHRDLRKQVTERFGFKLPDEAYDEEPKPRPLGVQGPPGVEPANQPAADPPPRRRPEDRGERELSAAHLESREAFRARVAPMLVVEKEGAPQSGGRFPESDGVRDSQPGAG